MQYWTKDEQGQTLYRYSLCNRNGMKARFCNLGASLLELHVPNTQQHLIPCVLGYKDPNQFIQDQHFLGVTVGRYCNRIDDARFSLNGQTFQLTPNEGSNQLHGGAGFAKRLWTCLKHTDTQVRFGFHSPDGDQGFPGNLTVEALYELTEDNTLVFTWTAQSDADTVASLTNHAYFNLGSTQDVLSHTLQLPLSHYTPIDDQGIPTGAIAPVHDTVFDFTHTRKLQEHLTPLDDALSTTKGFDHNWCQAPNTWDTSCKTVARLTNPAKVLSLQVQSTLPGLQVYTGNHLAETGVFGTHEGICLETQFFPNSPNEPLFPSALLRAGERMTHQTRFQFGSDQIDTAK